MEFQKSGLENLEMMLTDYRNKKVFVTGHTGFKGGWLLALLSHLKAEIKGYALDPEYSEGIYNVIKGNNLCSSIINDIRNRDLLEKEIIDFQPDFIFHLAAQPLVRNSYELPSETFEVNIMGTSYLLEAARKLKKKCTVIIITTDKVYKNIESDHTYNENDALGGFDPYSASKACVELLANSFKNSFFHPINIKTHQKAIVTVRAGNVIGGGDFSKDRIIPDLIRALKNEEVLKIRNPSAIRPWQHVLEPLVGYLQLGLLVDKDPLTYSDAYNFGPKLNDHLSVEKLIKQAIFIWDEGATKTELHPTDLHEAGILKLDISLAQKELNWQPKYTAKQAIQQTMEWYKSENPLKQTFIQIETYLNLL